MPNPDGTLNGQDSIDPNALYDGADVYAGYDNGLWADYLAVAARFGNKKLIDYTVFYSNTAKAGDFEPGDMGPASAVPWVSLRRRAGVAAPAAYASIGGYMPQIAANLAAAFTRTQYKLISAHYGQGPHICGPHTCGSPIQCDATQYADKGPQGQNVDLSLFAADFFGAPDVATVFTPPANQPLSAAGTDQMLPGQVLMPGQALQWSGITWQLVNQTDGNVVLYDDKRAVRWQTNTVGKVGIFTMQTDGNLVHYAASGAVWNSHDNLKVPMIAGTKAEFQPTDGNFVLYQPNGSALWSTQT